MTVNASQTQDIQASDRIEKHVVVNAPRSRVWRAISTAKEFGEWFRVDLEGEFAEGTTVIGRLTHPGYEHVTMALLIQRIEPERYFSYRWHPDAVDASVDFTDEPTTLVEFIVEEGADGTVVTIVESGFDQIPLDRRAEAFRMNDKGWTDQIRNLADHVS